MPAMLDHLRSILPENITIGVAYGRMEGRQLEKVMLDFYDRKYDVLLCTTLIENGLDQPNANTMLVYDADRMGLSQIYQMRGRVGRSEKLPGPGFSTGRGKSFPKWRKKTGHHPRIHRTGQRLQGGHAGLGNPGRRQPPGRRPAWKYCQCRFCHLLHHAGRSGGKASGQEGKQAPSQKTA